MEKFGVSILRMENAGFILQAVTVDQGLSSASQFVLNGKHALLTPESEFNGVDTLAAIRWCLFGSSEASVDEWQYPDRSASTYRVSLELIGNDGLWLVERRLRSDSTRSQFAITNPEGKARRKSDVFPRLRIVNPMDGIYLIQSDTHANDSRANQSTGPSSPVLPPNFLESKELLQRLDAVIQAQSQACDEIAAEIADLEKNIQERLEQIDDQIAAFLADVSASGEISEISKNAQSRVVEFAEEIAALLDEAEPIEGSPGEILHKIAQWCNLLSNDRLDELEKKLRETEEEFDWVREEWEAACLARQKVSEAQAYLLESGKELGAALQTDLLIELEKQLGLLDQRIAGESEREKPDKQIVSGHLQPEINAIFQLAELGQDDVFPEFREVNRKLAELADLYREVAGTDEGIAHSGTQSGLELAEMALTVKLTNLMNEIQRIESEVEFVRMCHQKWEERIEALGRDVWFQSLQAERAQLIWHLAEGLDPVREQYTQMLEGLQSAQRLKRDTEQEVENLLEQILGLSLEPGDEGSFGFPLGDALELISLILGDNTNTSHALDLLLMDFSSSTFGPSLSEFLVQLLPKANEKFQVILKLPQDKEIAHKVEASLPQGQYEFTGVVRDETPQAPD